jgi:hypothetical protein
VSTVLNDPANGIWSSVTPANGRVYDITSNLSLKLSSTYVLAANCVGTLVSEAPSPPSPESGENSFT